MNNQLAHARRGQVAIHAIERSGVPGLEIVAADLGPGIADPRLALDGPGPSDRSLGAGISGARRMVHELDVDVRWGQGTCVRARAFAEPLPRRREIGILGRPIPGERISGDHAVFARAGDVLLCAVIDGLGHGPLAADASDHAAAVALASLALTPAAILEACDTALEGTRGAVMAVAVDEAAGAMELASVGNVTTGLAAHRSLRLFSGTSATLGMRGRKRRVRTENAPADRDEMLLLYTDGMSTRVTLEDEPGLLRDHPIVIAQYLLGAFGREHDDVLVLVAR